MNGWRPIDSAPKDGTEFLAYDSAARKQDVCIFKNLRAPSFEPLWICQPVQVDGAYGPLNDEFGYDWKHITHWQPLPEPPSS